MGKNKYCYVIVHEDTNKMLLEDGKLPIYWTLTAVKNRMNDFNSLKYSFINIELELIEKIIKNAIAGKKLKLLCKNKKIVRRQRWNSKECL